MKDFDFLFYPRKANKLLNRNKIFEILRYVLDVEETKVCWKCFMCCVNKVTSSCLDFWDIFIITLTVNQYYILSVIVFPIEEVKSINNDAHF